MGIATRLRKLCAMSPAELAGRGRYAARLAAERRFHQVGLLTRADRFAAALGDGFHGPEWRQRLVASRLEHRRSLFAGPRDRDGMRLLFASDYREEAVHSRCWASRAIGHEFGFFGLVYRPGPNIDWHADPVSGARWPVVYHADAARVGADCGDPKYVWELNRQQFVADLGKAVFLFDDDAAWDAVKRLIRSWMAVTPYARGIHWSCALEPAYRSLAWLWAYELTHSRLSDDPDFHVEWLTGFYDAGRFLERHMELHTSPYNHLIGEATALYLLGLFLPELKIAQRWRRIGRHVLETRLGEQFYEDGATVEQATFYHHATLGFYILAGLAARDAGEEFSPAVWGAIERAIDFSMWMTQPDGRVPAIGDTDDAKPVCLERRPLWDFRHFLSVGAVLFERPDFKAVAGGFWEDALWLLGQEGRERFEALPARVPDCTSRMFRASGYCVFRSGWGSGDDFVWFDCGEQAGGLRHDAVPSAAHGHADCLSVGLTYRGAPVLVDAGLFTYNGEPSWERFFRETAAHNTVRVDGRDQATHLDKMAWCHIPRSRLEVSAIDEAGARAVGSHDGYARGVRSVVHRRAVWWRPGGVLLVVDWLSGKPPHDIEVCFLFAPASNVRLDSNRLLSGDSRWTCAWIATAPICAAVQTGGPSPDGGWAATSLGVKVPAPRLVLSMAMTTPDVLCLTALAPGSMTLEPAVASNLAVTDLTGCVTAGGIRDYVSIAAAPEPRITVQRDANGIPGPSASMRLGTAS